MYILAVFIGSIAPRFAHRVRVYIEIKPQFFRRSFKHFAQVLNTYRLVIMVRAMASRLKEIVSVQLLGRVELRIVVILTQTFDSGAYRWINRYPPKLASLAFAQVDMCTSALVKPQTEQVTGTQRQVTTNQKALSFSWGVIFIDPVVHALHVLKVPDWFYFQLLLPQLHKLALLFRVGSMLSDTLG